MLHLQKCIEVDDIRAGSGEDEGENSDDDLSASYTISGGEHTIASPIEIGNLCVTSLGNQSLECSALKSFYILIQLAYIMQTS